jgi:transposase-like protein
MVLGMPRSRLSYPVEFRREAVGLVRGGRSVKDVAASLGCSQQALFTWVKRYELDHMERDDGLRSDEREGFVCCVGRFGVWKKRRRSSSAPRPFS